jgi:hypothetical protein
MTTDAPATRTSTGPRRLTATRMIALVLAAGALVSCAPAAQVAAPGRQPAALAHPAAIRQAAALRQLDWLIGASAGPPVPTAELDRHLTPSSWRPPGARLASTRHWRPSAS